MATDSSNIEVRTCSRCGEEFYGLSAQTAQENLEEHYSSCRIAEEQHNDDYHVNISLRPPRELSQYAYTEHFNSMKVRRDAPKVTDDIIEATIKRGLIKSTHKNNRVIFERYDKENWCWWVLAQIKPEAFRSADRSHLLVTVYAKNSDAHEVVNKYA